MYTLTEWIKNMIQICTTLYIVVILCTCSDVLYAVVKVIHCTLWWRTACCGNALRIMVMDCTYVHLLERGERERKQGPSMYHTSWWCSAHCSGALNIVMMFYTVQKDTSFLVMHCTLGWFTENCDDTHRVWWCVVYFSDALHVAGCFTHWGDSLHIVMMFGMFGDALYIAVILCMLWDALNTRVIHCTLDAENKIEI